MHCFQFWTKSVRCNFFLWFCSSVICCFFLLCGPNFAQIFLILKSSLKICRIVFLLIFNAAVIIWRVICRFVDALLCSNLHILRILQFLHGPLHWNFPVFKMICDRLNAQLNFEEKKMHLKPVFKYLLSLLNQQS